MDSKLSRWCDGLIEVGWLAAVLAIPLFFNIHSERVFEPDKLTLLRSIALVMVGAWVVKFVDQRGWAQWRSGRASKQAWRNPEAALRQAQGGLWHRPFVLPVLAIVVVYLLATILSVTPRVSFFGSYQRLQGTYTTLSYIVIFALLATHMRSRSQVRRLISAVIVTSIPISFYGLLQHFALDPLPWGGDTTNRVAGHMGNAIFIAAYLIMVVPLTLGRIIDAFSDILTKEVLSYADVLRSSIYIFTLAIQLLTIYWSGSRGPLIALGVGLFAFTLILLVSLRDAGTGKGTYRPRDALPALLFLLPSVLALFLSGAVGAATSPLVGFAFFMGIALLSVLAIFVLMAVGRGWRWLWLGWMLLTAFLAFWLILFNLPERVTSRFQDPLVGGVFVTLAEWRELPTIGSYGKMLDPSNNTGREKSGRVRVLIWEGVIDLITPHTPLEFPDGGSDPFNVLRPLIGYGPESMYVAYNRFYPAELATVEARNASPDRSHNETFDTLVITGMVGFLAWQALYLSVVYYGFHYLGVVRSRRDRNMLIGFWVAGAIIAGLISIWLVDPIYFGVAVPTGVIVGVIAYLVYHALFGRSGSEVGDAASSTEPFHADRLLMSALVAAVLAHYVEIHFGIAIASTRLHFFVYVGLMFVLGYALPRLKAETTPIVETPTPKKRRKAAPAEPVRPVGEGWGQLGLVAVLMALTVGIMGYGFITYALPPGKEIAGPADLTVGEIIQQSLLLNAKREFVESPFLFLLIVVTWLLGWLIFLSEMVKHDELKIPASIRNGLRDGLPEQRRKAAAALFALLGVAGVGGRLLTLDARAAGAILGGGLALVWATICLWTAFRLFTNSGESRLLGGILALSGLTLILPLLIAGAGLYALALLVVSALALYLLWDKSWTGSIVPVGALVGLSLAIGLLYTYFHTSRYRASLFFQPPAALTNAAEIRAAEASQAASYLSFFYLYFFAMLLLGAMTLVWPAPGGVRRRSRAGGGVPAVVSLLVVGVVAGWLISQTNMRVVQADMIFKRAKPFDDDASRLEGSDPQMAAATWDAAIAIYRTAIERAPEEDFYYLFLGRAYLERAGLSADAAAQTELLAEARDRLLLAQDINPLNTDHTANLARLNTRWYGVEASDEEKAQRLQTAEAYYEEALNLSPQNSVIRNEYARLVLELERDCDRAIGLYNESVTVDPFFVATYLAQADALVTCGTALPEEERAPYYQAAAASLEQAVARDENNVLAWMQLAEMRLQVEDFEEALAAVEGARTHNDNNRLPQWELDTMAARIYLASGDFEQARALAMSALAAAPENATGQLEELLAQIDAGSGDE